MNRSEMTNLNIWTGWEFDLSHVIGWDGIMKDSENSASQTKEKYRPQLWSVETGYVSGTSSILPTPLPTPIKQFDFRNIDRRDHCQSESDDVFLPTPLPTPVKKFDFRPFDRRSIDNRQSEIDEVFLPTPAPTPIKKFDFRPIDRRSIDNRQSEIDEVFLPTPIKKFYVRPIDRRDRRSETNDNSPILKDTASGDTKPKFRPITKKFDVQDEVPETEDEAIMKLAQKLDQLRKDLYEKGVRKLDEDEMVENKDQVKVVSGPQFPELTRKDGWKYPQAVLVPSMVDNRKRYVRKREPNPTCEFCRNNNDPNCEFHQCKNEYGEVVCPVLANLICPICGATGTRAHTRRHCPRDERRKRRELEMGSTKVGSPSYYWSK